MTVVRFHVNVFAGLMNPLAVILVLSPTIVIAMAYLARCTTYIAKTVSFC